MTEYICKCGRIVHKNSTAENTGNRDTARCAGCPYLLPWGDTAWDETRHAMVANVKGCECRMSRDLDYATRFGGNVHDKCTCCIASLDFDFLERVSAWIAAAYPGREIFGRFDRETIRPVEYASSGRYRFVVTCTQNKAGVAAKAALLEQFFHPDGSRRDLTPEQEKEKVLADIAAGRAAAQKQEDTPMERKQYQTDTGMVCAVRALPSGSFRIMCRCPGADWALATHPYLSAECACAASLQEVLDAHAERQGWKECPPEAAAGPCADCRCRSCADPDCPQARCDGADQGLGCIAPNEDCPAPQTTEGKEPAVCQTQSPNESNACSSAPAAGSAPALPADGGSDAPALTAASPASVDAASTRDMDAPAFDYAGLDAQTVADLHLAEREYAGGKRMAEMGLRRMADGVAIAHDALCGAVVAKCDNGQFAKKDDTFRAWCASIGISKDTAYRLLQVSDLFLHSSPKQQKVLEELSPSLLYAAARPSAPAEAVAAVRAGDVTTHKEYQELVAQLQAEQARADGFAEEIKTRDAKITELLDASEAADRRAAQAAADAKAAAAREEQARAAAHKYHTELEDTRANQNALLDRESAYIAQVRTAEREREDALRRATEAEKALEGSRQLADRWKEKAEAARAQAAPATVEAVVDQDEVNRLAEEKAQALAAQQTAKSAAEVDALQAHIDRLEGLLTGAEQDQIANAQALAAQAVEACENLMESLFDSITILPDAQYYPAKRVVENFAARLGWALGNDDWPDDHTWAWAQCQNDETEDAEDD